MTACWWSIWPVSGSNSCSWGQRKASWLRLAQNPERKVAARTAAAQTVTRLHQAEEQARQAVAALRQRQQHLPGRERGAIWTVRPPLFGVCRSNRGNSGCGSWSKPVSSWPGRRPWKRNGRHSVAAAGVAGQGTATRNRAAGPGGKTAPPAATGGCLEQNHRLSLRIHSYEEERARLENGTPCPLCGSPTTPGSDEQPVVEAVRRSTYPEPERAGTDAGGNEPGTGKLVGLTKDIEHAGRTVDKGRKQRAEAGATAGTVAAVAWRRADTDRTALTALCWREAGSWWQPCGCAFRRSNGWKVRCIPCGTSWSRPLPGTPTCSGRHKRLVMRAKQLTTR